MGKNKLRLIEIIENHPFTLKMIKQQNLKKKYSNDTKTKEKTKNKEILINDLLSNARSIIKDNQSEKDFKQNIFIHLQQLVEMQKNKEIKV